MARHRRAGGAAGAMVVIVVAIVLAMQSTSRRGGGEGAGRGRAAAPGAGAAVEREAGAAPAAVRIGAWNIEWLGKPEDRSGPARGVAQSPDDLADCIVESKVAVLGLEEVVTRVAGRPIRSRELEAVIEALKARTRDQWDYMLFPGWQDGDQLTGVMWNTAVVSAIDSGGAAWSQPEDQPWALPIARARSAKGTSLWNRPPHAMKFSMGKGQTDFVVVVLHMKADYQGDFASHRAEEAAALVGALPAVRKTFQDTDVVLLGDTNCVQAREPAVAAIEQAGFADLNSDGQQTHWRGGTMDRIFVVGDQPETRGAKMEVVSNGYLREKRLTPEQFKRRYSDHFMVVTTIGVMADDD